MGTLLAAAALAGSLLTLDDVKQYAASCQHLVPPDWIVSIAGGESQVSPGLFDPRAISKPNRNGTRDFGLMQVNETNLKFFGLTEPMALEPCISVAAAAAVLAQFSSYNSGSPTKSGAYAKAAYLRLRNMQAGADHPVDDVRSVWTLASQRYNCGRIDCGQAYARKIDAPVSRIQAADVQVTDITASSDKPESTEKPPPSWDVWRLEVWRRQHVSEDNMENSK